MVRPENGVSRLALVDAVVCDQGAGSGRKLTVEAVAEKYHTAIPSAYAAVVDESRMVATIHC